MWIKFKNRLINLNMITEIHYDQTNYESGDNLYFVVIDNKTFKMSSKEDALDKLGTIQELLNAQEV